MGKQTDSKRESIKLIDQYHIAASSITSPMHLRWTAWDQVEDPPIAAMKANLSQTLEESGLVAAAAVLMRKYAMHVDTAQCYLEEAVLQQKLCIGSMTIRDALWQAYYEVVHIPLGSGLLRLKHPETYQRAAFAGSMREWRTRIYEFLMAYRVEQLNDDTYRIGDTEMSSADFGDVILRLHPYYGTEATILKDYYVNIRARIDQIINGDHPVAPDLLGGEDVFTLSEQRLFFKAKPGRLANSKAGVDARGYHQSVDYPTNFPIV